MRETIGVDGASIRGRELVFLKYFGSLHHTYMYDVESCVCGRGRGGFQDARGRERGGGRGPATARRDGASEIKQKT